MSMNINHFDYGHRERSPSICELKPTWRCAIFSTKDALLLVQKCILGELQAIIRRPHDRERAELVKPGNVFVYTESDSGIKRWTDGVNWSPSRILNNFLVYRELDKAFGPGEKKKATKRPKRYSPYSRDSPGRQQHPTSDNEDIIVAGAHRRLTKDEERMLVGSLNDSYQFKQDGLIKKTFSITYGEQVFHVVSYYSYYAFLELDLPRPQEHWDHDKIFPEFLTEQNFRVPINAEGHEITGSTRDRVNHDSLSRSPPQMDHNPYPVNMVRYTNHSVTPFGGYNLNAPLHPTQLHSMGRPPGDPYYHPTPTYQGMRSDTESTHQYSYSPQPPRYPSQTSDYNGHPGNEYPDSIHSQGQIVTSPPRFNDYGYSATTAPQLPGYINAHRRQGSDVYRLA